MLKSIGLISGVIVATVWAGYVMTILWGWFVVDVFGVSAITLPQSLGLLLIARSATIDSRFKQTEDTSAIALSGFIIPTFALFLGYIYTLFM